MNSPSNNDAERWNVRYSCPGEGVSKGPNQLLVEHLDLLPPRGTAVDFAMGLGWNAEILLERNWDVIGIDIAYQALKLARKRNPNLSVVVADLKQFTLPANRFNLILNFNYLQRDLFAQFEKILLPGGMIMVETLSQIPVMLQEHREFTPEHYLESGELLRIFPDWDIILYEEKERKINGKLRGKSSLIARLPENCKERCK